MLVGSEELIRGCRFIEVARHADVGMELSVLEIAIQAGFLARRIFYMAFDDPRPNQCRADHATTGHQIVVPLIGQYRLELNNGIQQCAIECMPHDNAVLIGPGVWRRISRIASGTVLLVIAEETYAETRYFPDAVPELWSKQD